MILAALGKQTSCGGNIRDRNAIPLMLTGRHSSKIKNNQPPLYRGRLICGLDVAGLFACRAIYRAC
jgi:hypothetical protein